MPPEPPPDPWSALRGATRARIGLGRSGDAIPLRHVLEFQRAHAAARDAVHAALDATSLAKALAPRGVIEVHSAAAGRAEYLRRPDLGRRLDPTSRAQLPHGTFDAVFVLADGLSATAVQRYAPTLVLATERRLPGWRFAPVVVAAQARVALGDEVGAALGARLVVVLIGERPGLSVAESLGVYLTYAPIAGKRDSERNCISNIHDEGGLRCEAAADKLAWLMTEAVRRRLSGVSLKDEAPQMLSADPAEPALVHKDAP